MDQDTAKYIVTYFSKCLTAEERLAIRHTHSLIKLGLDTDPAITPSALNIYKKAGWLTENKSILNLLKDGYDSFEIRVAKRILNQEKIFLNNCPDCGKLARTPSAKQCRFCAHRWS
ncbi:hypothetical protein G7074_03155 [Pedobacter sp. HDW13]|uniref:hypothetical protein n=1 Tax=unclassified Pedobacter TaxID=2628915 RepID=UPI000F5A21FC|nr:MULTISPECIES: hypothetical protein [unclassified Pedobacter]QIL38363.1 hypothetical protein G7074_03155 [Pedobacter sp. HDW13]RQO73783.1 hypothetical protein DBR40_13320 [Pedobacter sp. KBW01]